MGTGRQHHVFSVSAHHLLCLQCVGADMMPYQSRKHEPKRPGQQHVATISGHKKLIKKHQWAKVRASYVKRFPLCCDPFGIHQATGQVIAVEEVHHVRSRRTHPQLAFTWSNLRSLCRACHGKIEGMERAGNPTQQLFSDTMPIE